MINMERKYKQRRGTQHGMRKEDTDGGYQDEPEQVVRTHHEK